MVSAKKNDVLFLLVVVLFWFAQYVFVPFLSPRLELLGIGASLAGTIIGAYGFSQLLLRIPISVTEDCLGHDRTFMLGGLAVMTIGSTLPIISEAPAVYLVSRALMGAGASTWVSFSVSFTRGAADAKTRMARLVFANNLGILLSYVVGGLIEQKLGMKALFVMSLIAEAAALCLIPACRLSRDEKTSSMRSFSLAELWHTFRNKRLLLCCLFGALTQLISFATAMSFTNNYAKTLGASGFDISLISVTGYVGGIAASAAFSKGLFSRISERAFMALGFTAFAAYCVLVPFCQSIAAVACVQVLGGVARTLLYTYLMAANSTDVPSGQKTTAMGIFQSLYSLGMTAGPIVMGRIMDASAMNYSLSFTAIGALAALGALISLIVWGKKAIR